MVNQAKGPQFLNLGQYDPSQQVYIGRAHNLPPEFRGSLHRHTHYELMWLESGSTVFFSDFNNVEIKAGTMMFIRPGQLHTLRGNMDTIDLIVVSYKPELLAQQSDPQWFLRSMPFFMMGSAPYLFAKGGDQALLSNLFHTVYRHYKTLGEENRELLSSYIQVLLNEAERLYQLEDRPRAEMTAANQLTKAFYDSVDHHFLTQRTTSPYADKLGVTANHLTRIIRQTTGMTPGKILRDRLLLESKRMLVHTNRTINEISLALGFGSAAQFSNWFKREAAQSPSDFRGSFETA